MLSSNQGRGGACMNNPDRKEEKRQYYLKNKEAIRRVQKTYEQQHLEKMHTKNKIYHKRHAGKVSERKKRYWREHKNEITSRKQLKSDIIKQKRKVYNLKNRFKQREACRNHYINNKDYYCRKDAKRKREMEFSPLNIRFDDSHGHHIDNKIVIFIPKDIHRSIYHNHKKPETMNNINIVAWDFLERSVL
jgi:hypothetical protein